MTWGNPLDQQPTRRTHKTVSRARRVLVHSETARGITLLELLIVLSIVTTLLTIGVPSFSGKVGEWRSRAQAVRLLSAIHLARSFAVKLSSPVTLCPGAHVGASPCAGLYSAGFSIVDESGDMIRHYPERSQITVWNSTGIREENRPISWQADGLGSRNMSWLFCPTGDGAHWAVVVNRIGRPRLVQDWGSCPA